MSAEQLINAGKFLFANGWSSATSSNYSLRLDETSLLITESGKHKGYLSDEDLMPIDYEGKALVEGKKPSAETLLHTHLYSDFDHVNCVLHTHSVNATVLTLQQPHLQQIQFMGYEMVKAFAGVESHKTRVVIPIFENTQDISVLSIQVQRYLKKFPNTPGYLIRGHGLYTWGENVDECLKHVEAFEFLLECELKSLTLR